ncbi:glycerol kinase-like [Copidosoma floridanum]|uniref:glycerol kinase-like n=1 Tax=Copidosoma floridanum TaxID=29053 RepID=UPI000C6F5E53|nr:glycerol kinase-like [Copidosoma floridanum]
MWPRPTRMRRAWPVLVFVLLAAGGLLLFAKSGQNEDPRYDPARDFVHLELSEGQREYIDKRGVHVVVGHYVGNSMDSLQVPNITKELINKNMFDPRAYEGTNGSPVQIPAKDFQLMQQLFQINRYNLLASDRIPLNRSLPDVRKKMCTSRYANLSDLPTTSVIIVFHNEAWSTLLRTVHSVINRSPKRLLKEIILVDDSSDREFLRRPLDKYVALLEVPTRVLRSANRIGLVNARLMGASQARGDVLTFLDAHCECTAGWLEPLLEAIFKNRTRVVSPVIDIINDDTFSYTRSFELHWGAFNWDLHFRWLMLNGALLRERRENAVDPFKTPAMAGGLFSMERDYFFELGSYDERMRIWGGENLELSFRVWQCGGSVEIAPCSHVGHIFRKSSPYTFPGGVDDVLYGNLARVALVWMDDWGKYGPLIGAIDEGTSSARFLVFTANTAEVLTYHQKKLKLSYPQEGWVEQDPMEILEAVHECLNQTVENLKQLMINPADIVAIGITNQRETTIVWDSQTGKPLYNAIVWMDMRTTTIIDAILKKVRNHNKDYLKSLCGLPISPYFSALKLKWLMENVREIQEAIKDNRCMFGTVDSWLIWNLTGGAKGGVHCTDVTNASRTMLMNLVSLKWDPYLLSFFEIPESLLPQIRSSSEIYGNIDEGVLQGIPISGCLGDQQAAIVGQMCFQHGQAKSTYGTGCFLLYNTGTKIVESAHGLLTTVAYQFGPNADPVYALEGSVAIAGAIVRWLQENLEVISDVKETETIIEKLSTDNRIIFVPAFSGLYAPYWRKDARSVICGITEDINYGHIVKAALQSVCFQVRDILEAMKEDTGMTLTKLLVDGAMTSNNALMQMQADICGVPVVRPVMCEITALGVAIAAGSAEGIKKWDINVGANVPSDTFTPAISENERDILYSEWKKGIERSLDWETEVASEDEEDTNKMTAPGLFMFSTILLLIYARFRLRS